MIGELDRPKIERLAELLDFPFDWGADADQRRQAAMLPLPYQDRGPDTVNLSEYLPGT
jgi:hypothetical protein